MAEADNLKTVRDTLLAERERLGIRVPAGQIGTSGSTAPIDAGMSHALEQLVMLAQLHSGRSEGDITRGYSEGTINLVRQYMADRGVPVESIDRFTASIQALDTVAQGQTKSTFDQQYRPGATDLTMFKLDSQQLLAGTQRGTTIPPAGALRQNFATQTTTPDPATTTVERATPTTVEPEVPTRSVRVSYSYDDISAIRDKSVRSVEETAALEAWQASWNRYAGQQGYSPIYNAREEAKAAYDNRFNSQREMITQRTGLMEQNETLLTGLKDRQLTLRIDGQTYRMSWNEVQAEVGWAEWNDSDFQTKLRNAANRALEGLKESEGYNARTTEIAGLNRRISTHFSDTYQALQTAQRALDTAWGNIRDDKIQITLNVPDYEAHERALVAAAGGGRRDWQPTGGGVP